MWLRSARVTLPPPGSSGPSRIAAIGRSSSVGVGVASSESVREMLGSLRGDGDVRERWGAGRRKRATMASWAESGAGEGLSGGWGLRGGCSAEDMAEDVTDGV